MRKLFLIFFLTMGAAHGSATPPSVLRIGMVGEPTTLNPVFRSSSEEGIVNGLSSRSLAHFDAESELVPGLAKEKPYFKRNDLVFEIRENAKWDDGTPVVCDDFRTSFLADQKFRKSNSPKVLGISWDPKTPRICKIQFRRRKPIYTLYISPPIPTAIERKIIESSQNEMEYLKNTTYTVNPAARGLYAGPFKISVYKPGYYLELIKNPFFYGAAPPIDKVQVRFFKDLQGLMNAFRTQEIDLISYGLTTSRADEIQKIIDKDKLNSLILSKTTTKLTHLEFNLESKAVGDLRIRRALSLMIDPKELALLVGADGEITGSLEYPSDPLFSDSDRLPLFSKDRRRAQALLAEAGFHRNGAGDLLNKEGRALEINLLFNSENLDRERVALYLQESWNLLGIKVNLKKQLKRLLMGETLKKGNFDVAVFGWSRPKLQVSPQFFSADTIPTEQNHWTGVNFSRWKNARADQALEAADLEFDLKKIKKHLGLFNKEFHQDLPWLPLYFEKRVVVVPKALKNYKVFPDWEDETYGLENWWHSEKSRPFKSETTE